MLTQNTTWNCLFGYRCPGCSYFDSDAEFDAHDLLIHTLSITGRKAANTECEYCPWCGEKVCSKYDLERWYTVAKQYDKHLPQCGRYKLCCLGRLHPTGDPPNARDGDLWTTGRLPLPWVQLLGQKYGRRGAGLPHHNLRH